MQRVFLTLSHHMTLPFTARHALRQWGGGIDSGVANRHQTVGSPASHSNAQSEGRLRDSFWHSGRSTPPHHYHSSLTSFTRRPLHYRLARWQSRPIGGVWTAVDIASEAASPLVPSPLSSSPPPMSRPPLPPFTLDSAVQKVRLAENAWNTRNPQSVALAYTEDSRWRNRSAFLTGRPAIIAFLTSKWSVERNYRLIKELWCHSDSHIAVRFVYEWQAEGGQWWRSHGNEMWQFNGEGLMEQRHASINDVAIEEGERKFRWDSTGPRPADHPGLTELGL